MSSLGDNLLEIIAPDPEVKALKPEVINKLLSQIQKLFTMMRNTDKQYKKSYQAKAEGMLVAGKGKGAEW